MPMKDRLEEFQTKAASCEESGRIKEAEPSSKMTGGKTLQNFLKEVEQIQSNLTKMKDNITSIKKLQQDLLNSPFCEKNKVAKYESMGEEIRRDANKIGATLKQIDKKYDEKNLDLERDNTLLRVRTQQLNTLTTEFNLATSEFFKTQAEYVDKMKDRLKRLFNDRGDAIPDESKISTILDQESYSVFTENYAMNVQNAEQTLRDLDNRKNDILKLEKGVSDVNQLFNEMNLILAEQGETLAAVDKKLYDTEVNVVHAKKYLQAAEYNQSQARRKWFCICGVIFIVLLIVGIILTIIFVNNK